MKYISYLFLIIFLNFSFAQESVESDQKIKNE